MQILVHCICAFIELQYTEHTRQLRSLSVMMFTVTYLVKVDGRAVASVTNCTLSHSETRQPSSLRFLENLPAFDFKESGKPDCSFIVAQRRISMETLAHRPAGALFFQGYGRPFRGEGGSPRSGDSCVSNALTSLTDSFFHSTMQNSLFVHFAHKTACTVMTLSVRRAGTRSRERFVENY